VGAGSAMEKAIFAVAVVLEVGICLFVGIVRLFVVTSAVAIGVRLWEM
jgi:hypothetical protein